MTAQPQNKSRVRINLTGRRAPKPQPAPVDPGKVAAGLRAFADDLDAGDTFALESLTPRGEMPHSEHEWAAYPTSYVRRARIAHLGKPGPGYVPDEAFDWLDAEIEAERGRR
jgi:hypothetical protein